MTDRSVVETEFCCSGDDYSEDEDAKTPIARSQTASVSPWQQQPASQGAGSRRREQLVRQGIDSTIWAVLDYKFTLGRDRYTLLDASGPEICNLQTGQPEYGVILALQNALDRYSLNLDKKRQLFEILGWKFECLACRQIKAPAEFQGTSYIFWGPDPPTQCYLRSGPCVACKEVARKSNHPQNGLVAYRVTHP